MMNPCTICAGFFHAIFFEKSPLPRLKTCSRPPSAPRAVACGNLHLRASAHLWHIKKNGTQLVPKLSTVSLFLTFLTAVRPHRSRSAVCFLHVFHILENIAEIKCSEVILRSLRPADHLDPAVFLEKKLCAL